MAEASERPDSLGPPSSSGPGNEISPKQQPRAAHFAVAGQIIARRKTVFAAVPIAVVRPNPHQPRQHFDPESLRELAESIRERGLLQPIIVRRDQEGGYTLIAGERRLRAAEMAGIGLVPAILSDDLLEVALEENLQREDLSPIEEAEALSALANERGHSHARLAEVIHKSRPYVSNTLTLTRLPLDIKQEYLAEGATVPREIMIAIARQATPDAMRALWRRVKLQQMSVKLFRERQSERPAPRSDGRQIVRAARRLGRALRAVNDFGTLSDAEAQHLLRILSRAQRRIGDALTALRARSAGTAGVASHTSRSAQAAKDDKAFAGGLVARVTRRLSGGRTSFSGSGVV